MGMSMIEYKVIPAPVRRRKMKGLSGKEDAFSATLSTVFNELAVDGWEFVQAEVLPEETGGWLRRRRIEYRHLLIFRRPDDASAAFGRPIDSEAVAKKPALEPVQPRRVRNPEAVRKVREGARQVVPAIPFERNRASGDASRFAAE